MKPKKTPMRMCVGCREMKPKRELIRVVRGPESVDVDTVGKAPGRGAYLCPDEACLKRAIKTRGLERALEHKIDESVYERLRAQLPQEPIAPPENATGSQTDA